MSRPKTGGTPLPVIPGGKDAGWRLYATLLDWTGKADTKAATVLALETAVLGVLSVLLTGNGRSAGRDGLDRWLAVGSVIALCAAIGAVAWSIFPRLSRRRSTSTEERFVYFGDLRHWSAERLAARLQDVDGPAELAVLAEHLVVMSRILWRKHTGIQVSLCSAGVACVLLLAMVVF